MGMGNKRPRVARPSRSYFWVMGSYNGKRFRLGPFGSEQEASEYGYEKLPCPFDIKELNTSDIGKAGGIQKKSVLDDTGDMGGAMRRGIRTPPDRYKRGHW